MSTKRRTFLQQVALASAAAQSPGPQPPAPDPAREASRGPASEASYPRVFTGRHLTAIAFPLGGVCAGCISLGGRGQLRDWEIFNRPDKGNNPTYAFPAIWAQAGTRKPVARVLESRIQPPYSGSSGLGANNAPGLTRLASATFTGEFPFARIDFTDAALPVRVSLEAFTPFIPHEPDDSGLPVAILRYRVSNPGATPAKVSIAWSIDNPTGRNPQKDTRVNDYRASDRLAGIVMGNPDLPAADPLRGSFMLAALLPAGHDPSAGARVTYLRGWERSRWWNSPMFFWDDFSADGELGPEAKDLGTVGALCLGRTIASGTHADFTFLLSWHFPNRTPRRCGWSAPKGEEDALIGNHYTTRFADAWAAAEYAAEHLTALGQKTRRFSAAIRESTIPPVIKDAATANLSTLVTPVCFRTADGEFHGFEGANDHAGCCHGSCAHVWNYETATAHLFPSFARSLRAVTFGYDLDEAGGIRFREQLPHSGERYNLAAADGQMGQIMHAYLDWILSGDEAWLRDMWPRVKRAIEFAWVPGGWDADKDGVLEGVQHNTYDVEFYGPNPLCGIFYLGALRAAEEMARAAGDTASASEYRALFERGSKWIDANLFNGEFYVQKIQGIPKDKIAPHLVSNMGSADTENPEYQVGGGCLLDQLIGQYLAEVAGLGPLLAPANIHKTLESIWRYNYKRTLEGHDSVQRTYVLNDEPALMVCDYGKAERPHVPFPYYAESWTGQEYLAAAHLIFAGMPREGIEAVRNVRARYDGERRNPWNEPECGHHYARALSSWSTLLAASNFRYHGGERSVTIKAPPGFRCFWSTATGWGTFRVTQTGAVLRVDHGELRVRTATVNGKRSTPGATIAEGKELAL
ncbi:MAG TPA: GH116 family glycosyl-hydrolase [Verrucomicrobiae bacterium]|nr:GH116 family glycosyl-hydrolase [Verrucomicrobiae bacterium]